MSWLVTTGALIGSTRRDRHLTQAQLAKLAGLSRATVDALENARASDIGVSRLQRVLSVLDLEMVVRPANRQRPTLEDLLAEADDD